MAEFKWILHAANRIIGGWGFGFRLYLSHSWGHNCNKHYRVVYIIGGGGRCYADHRGGVLMYYTNQINHYFIQDNGTTLYDYPYAGVCGWYIISDTKFTKTIVWSSTPIYPKHFELLHDLFFCLICTLLLQLLISSFIICMLFRKAALTEYIRSRWNSLEWWLRTCCGPYE